MRRDARAQRPRGTGAAGAARRSQEPAARVDAGAPIKNRSVAPPGPRYRDVIDAGCLPADPHDPESVMTADPTHAPRPDARADADLTPDAAWTARVCRLIDDAESAPALDQLAQAMGCSAGHLHRRFKAATGVTPKAYADARRARRLREALAEAPRVTDAAYDAGFGSSGRFYAQSQHLLGMTPSRYRAGGRHERLHFAVAESALGAVLVASSEKGVVAILIGDDADALTRNLQDRFAHAELVGADAGYEALVARVVGLVEAPGVGVDLPLDIRGTAFQQRVWQALQGIPLGRTVTYTELAARIGQPSAVRAVASACAANPLAVAVPCHRVVRTDGSLSGYAWGVERKRRLLTQEGALPTMGSARGG